MKYKKPTSVREAYTKIKRLEIQGARNIAIYGLDTISILVQRKTWKTKSKMLSDIEKAINLLKSARPTEPGLRNSLNLVLQVAKSGESVDEIRKGVLETIEKTKTSISGSLEKIIEVGVKRIPEGVVFTHCHSSTVTSILKAAWDQGKRFRVINTETRPRFQGRITARELAKHGIPVTHVVDSAARFYMNDADLLLVGGDAVTADGFLINKIGTSQIMLAAREARTMTASAVETFKFDPETLSGNWEPIEMRDPKEVWKNPPKGVKILNPAFDMTPPEFIDFMITDMGIIHPYEARNIILEKWFGGRLDD